MNTGVLSKKKKEKGTSRRDKASFRSGAEWGRVSFVPGAYYHFKEPLPFHYERFEPPHRRCDVLIACWRRRPSCVPYAEAPRDWMEGLVKWSVRCWIPKKKNTSWGKNRCRFAVERAFRCRWVLVLMNKNLYKSASRRVFAKSNYTRDRLGGRYCVSWTTAVAVWELKVRRGTAGGNIERISIYESR